MYNLFKEFYSPENVARNLIPQAQFAPYPKCGEVNTLTAAQKAEMIAAGEKYLGYDWPVPTALQYTKFVTEGTREPYEMANYRFRRVALATLMDAEYAEAKGRFIPDIVNGIWAIMDEATWVVPAHNDHRELPDFDQDVIIDLFSAGTAGMLSNAYYLFKEQIDAVSPLILRRLEIVMEKRILAPFMQNLYWWSGLGDRKTNNWNPWILSNILMCFGLVCKDDRRRAEAVARCLWMLDYFLDVYTIDGGCDEGPSYWGAAGAALFDSLCLVGDLIGGALDVFFDELLVQNIGRYIYRAHIAGPYFTNYADAPKKFRASCDLIYRYGKKIKDQHMMDLGTALFHLYEEMDKTEKDPKGMHGNVHHHYRHMVANLSLAELAAAPNNGFPLLENVFIDGIQLIGERQKGGSTEGLYLSAKGGHNNESHNHNDVGTFILYSDGQPVIVDLGSGLYNAFTFTEKRYEIPQMQSSYHNLPEINGCMQQVSGGRYQKGKLENNGKAMAAENVSYKNENGITVFSEDISGLYPKAAGVAAWQRTFTFDRNEKAVTVCDEAAFTGEKNFAETMFIVPVAPVVEGSTVTIAVEGARPVVLTGEGVTFTAEEVDMTYDKNLNNFWNGKVWRVKAAAQCGKEHKQTFTVVQG
ncbi:MAG: heparinase II/III family protein [Clostridia bacterium]|nr:heparinase II/III family protein [Clostridia bacterium]